MSSSGPAPSCRGGRVDSPDRFSRSRRTWFNRFIIEDSSKNIERGSSSVEEEEEVEDVSFRGAATSAAAAADDDDDNGIGDVCLMVSLWVTSRIGAVAEGGKKLKIS